MTRVTDIVVRGQVIDPRDEMIDKLNREADDLRRTIRQLQGDLVRVQSETARGVGNLRKQLGPLYQALRQVFGELESIGEGDATGGDIDPRTAQAWASWKQKLGSAEGKIIDALLAHGPLDTKALVIATGYHRTTLPRPLAKLRQAGLLLTRDGKYALREL